MLILTVLIFAIIVLMSAIAICGATSFISLIFAGDISGALVVLGGAIAEVYFGFSMARHWISYGRKISTDDYLRVKSQVKAKEFFGL